MRDTLRLRMGWLHEWVGFIGGLILVIVFTGGSLAMFDTELTHWMQPELSRYPATPLSDEALNKIGSIAQEMRKEGENPFITLPTSRDPMLRILHYDGHAFIGSVYNPEDGFPILARETGGGQLFFDLHHSLYYGPFWGNMLTEIAAIGLLIAVASGVIIHFRSILSDLLLFRPFSSRARAWMDAHILMGLLFLPFMVMMAYTGAVIHAPRLFPMFSTGHHGRPAHPQSHGPKERKTQNNVPGAHKSAGLAALAPMLHKAETVLGPDTIGLILFDRGSVSMTKADSASFTLSRDHVSFSEKDGAQIAVVQIPDNLHRIGGVLRGLHFVRWAGLPMRWLYFISGIVGSIMMSGGLILFLMKHRPRKARTFLFRLAETLTIAVTTGLPLACLAYLWANRLFWSDLPNRADLEIRAFFIVWALSLLHAALRSFGPKPRRGWNEQCSVFAAYALALLPLDLMTRSVNGFLTSFDVYKAVDLTAVGFGLIALFIHRRLVAP
ncbi:PepSY-associated TM helix domain-containing protein [Asaia prunellae]|uniref:PepSY-associated TM helix domain-containing protein n=1 Tax=Asaia prunellae TaxID=610245 RepID=UPI00046F9199|nr:PepSY-associated TM helix domain-containing protein [Asaia prunellae]